MQMNEQQRAAIKHTGTHQLIVAGPGTGKTHTLTQKILHLLSQGAEPASIVAITFTTKAAQEMQNRLEGETPFIGTFHALALHLLKHQGLDFTLLQPKKQDEIMSALKNLNQKQKKELKRVISFAKNHLVPLNEVETFLEAELVQELYDRYAQTLDEHQYLDFDDLLLKALEHLKGGGPRPRHLFIDEYQDINEIQYRLIRALSSEDTNIYAIGDPDQSIYAFRGSNIQHFLRFEQDFPQAHRITLTQNYRSTPQIVTAANTLIATNTERLDKTVNTNNEAGAPITLHPFEDEWQEAKFIARETTRLVGGTTMIESHHDDYVRDHHAHFSDIAVLYRTNAQARVLENVFKRNGLPYQCITSVPWYRREEVQELLSYLQFLITPEEENTISEGQKVLLQNYVRDHRSLDTTKPSTLVRSLTTALKYEEHLNDGTPRGLRKAENVRAFLAAAPMFDANTGEAGLQQLLHHFALLQEYDDYNPQAKAVSLMTLHAAKGLEFPVVFIAGLEDGLLPLKAKGTERRAHGASAQANEKRVSRVPVRMQPSSEIEEERRLLYVGMTRAKSRLYLTYAVSRNKKETQPSPFLAEIDAHLNHQEMSVRRKKQPDNQMSLL